ncbi:transmembrane protein 237-like [Gigantopelta aegis]|uniref:transmembrane protein 237-like n=1 Tax=Gigantopelta aegis TaxID=1735272 RepID=UPI001B8890A3|nr:transmembrane protein 237-like [Gigantopelta aegis]
MADENENIATRKPPISPRPKEAGDNPDVRPVKKKKKKKPSDSQEVTDAAEGEDPKPRRRRRSKSASRDTEGEANETESAPVTPKKKKRKRKLTEDAEDGQGDTERATEAQEDVAGSKASLLTNGTAGATPRKKKGKKKKKATSVVQHADDEFVDNGLAADLACINEDIIHRSELKDEPLPLTNLQNKPNLRSEPTPKVYIEINSGFKKENKLRYAKRKAAEEVEKVSAPEPSRQTTIDFALSAHRILKTFCLFLHGLTAGIAAWQIVIVYILSAHDDIDFLDHYQPLALPVQCMFYLLLVFCTVSACDRWDIGNMNGKFFVQAVTLHNGAVSILLYLAAIILSVTIVSTEDRMSLYFTNVDLWNVPSVRKSELTTWRAINTARGVLAVLGWFILSITPNADRLRKNLQEGDDDDVILGNEIQLSSPA